MMTFGTVGAFGFDDFHPPEVLGLYAGAGCSVVQAFRNRQREISPAEIRRVCGDLGLTIDSLHAHFGDDLDPSSEDESVRKSTLEVYAREAEYCRQVGGTLAVIHPSPARAPEGNLARRQEQFTRSLHDYARLGERLGVVFAFENMPAYHPVGADVGRLVADVAKVDSPHVVFLLDFGHAHMTCGIAESIRLAGPHLKYTHVHDNDGVNDTHALPGRGTLPWEDAGAALQRIGYKGMFLLEVFELAPDLRRLLTPEWKARMGRILASDKSA